MPVNFPDTQCPARSVNRLPALIPNALAISPANCGGRAASGAMTSIAIHATSPDTGQKGTLPFYSLLPVFLGRP